MIWNIFKRIRELEERVQTLESQTAPVLMTVAERRAKKAAYSKQYYANKKLKEQDERTTTTEQTGASGA